MDEVHLAVFHGSGIPMTIRKICITEIKVAPNEILGKMLYSSRCGSDLHTIDGRRIEPTPSVLGHEGVAEVVISNRTEVEIGAKFTFSVIDSCSNCELCSRGLNQKCISLFKYGHVTLSNGSSLNGCYASHILIRAGTHVVTIPEHINTKIVAPVNCALATVINALSDIETLTAASNPGTVLVQGDGLLGIYSCAWLSSHGYKVFCSGLISKRLELISQFGGSPLHAEDSSKLIEANSIDIVVEVCGAKSTVPEAMRVLKPGGLYILVGMIHPDSHLNLTAEMIMRKCLTIRGVHNYSGRHLQTAVEFLCSTSDKFAYEKLYDPYIYTLNNISKAIEAAQSLEYHRVLVKPF